MENKVIRKIFNNISGRYDIANFFISLGVERYWRKRFIRFVTGSEKKLLDACCGTGYSTFDISKRLRVDAKIFGVDFSEEMLNIAKLKSAKYSNKKNRGRYKSKIIFLEKDVTSLDFENDYFDLISVVFGIRNITDRGKALEEFYRVCAKKGKLLIMEFNYPENKFIKRIYDFYLKHIMSNIGALITGNKKAYYYLSNSIRNFPKPLQFGETIEKAGWKIIKITPMTFGICTLFYAEK